MTLRNNVPAYVLALIARVQERRLLAALIPVGALLAAFYLVDRWIIKATKVPAEVFSGGSILAEALQIPQVAVLLVSVGIIPLVAYRRTSWRALRVPEMRLVVVPIALMLAWAFAAYDYNHYLDRGHAFDRLALGALALLVIAHPGFTGPFVVVAFLVVRQFEVPMGFYTWTDKRVAFDLLILFHVYVCLNAIVRHRPRALWLLALALVAGNYVNAGVTKVSLGWTERNELWNLFVAARANGWLGNIPQSQILSIASMLKDANAWLLWVTLASELLPFFWLVGRRLAIASLLGCLVLHIAIFGASGIFFWKWIAIDAVLMAGLLFLPKREVRALFGLRSLYLWLSFPLIFFLPRWAISIRLAWYDTELNTMFELEAVTEDGKVYPVPRGFMSPYDVVFSQNRFFYLAPDYRISMTYGGHKDWQVVEAVGQARSHDDILAIEQQFGRSPADYNEAAPPRFDKFIQQYFSSVNRAGKRDGPLGLLGAPHHIWQSAPPGAYTGQQPVRLVRVRMVQTFFRDDRSLDVTEDRVVRVIDIPRE